MQKCYTIYGESIGIAWIDYLEMVIKYGDSFYDEDKKIIELSDVFIKIERSIMPDSILDLYGDSRLLDLFLKKMQTLDVIPEFKSSYGKRLFDQMGIDQVAWMIERLKKKPETKAATISLLLPNDPGPRIPCLTLVDCKIREDKLHLFAHFRSQDVFHAYGNFNALFWLRDYICDQLGKTAGLVKIFCSSAHIYAEDYRRAVDIVTQVRENTMAKGNLYE